MSTDRDTSSCGEETPLTRKDVERLLQMQGGPEQIDRRGLNLKGSDLAYLNLAGVLLVGADLAGANLCETDLTGADLSARI